jgi:hypothetical protein
LRFGGNTLFALTNIMTETRIYSGDTGGPGGFDGYAGLVIGNSYQGEERTVLVPAKEEGAEPLNLLRIAIKLPNERTSLVTPEQWQKWFKKS